MFSIAARRKTVDGRIVLDIDHEAIEQHSGRREVKESVR